MTPDLKPGTTVAGRYTILEQLGQGGNASVHHAIDQRLDTDIALKVLHPQLASDATFVKRFRREARTLAQLTHPNILRFYELGQDEDLDVYYLVLEFMPGGTLKDRMGPERWEVDQALAVLHPVAQALDYAHTHQPPVIHRDLKPSNILFNAAGWPVVSDFGIARLLQSGSNDSSLTGDLVVGTPAYMSPEQVKGEADASSDRYALAVIAYELLAGRVPHWGSSVLQTLILVSSTPPRPLRQLNPTISESVEHVIMKALDPIRKQRYDTADAFVSAFSHASQRGSGPRTVITPRARLSAADPPRLGTPPPQPRPPVVRRSMIGPHVIPASRPAPRQNPPARSETASTGPLLLWSCVGAAVLVMVAGVMVVMANRNSPGPTFVQVVAPTVVAEPTTVITDVAPTATPQVVVAATSSATPAPTRRPATPTPSQTPTVSDLWNATLNRLDPLWGQNWTAFTQGIDEFLNQHPDYAPAKEKFYAALVEHGKSLIGQQQPEDAATVLQRAQSIFPDRPEAFVAAKPLTPTPTPSPVRLTAPAPVNQATGSRAVPAPASSTRAALPPAEPPLQPAAPPTKCVFGTPGCGG